MPVVACNNCIDSRCADGGVDALADRDCPWFVVAVFGVAVGVMMAMVVVVAAAVAAAPGQWPLILGRATKNSMP